MLKKIRNRTYPIKAIIFLNIHKEEYHAKCCIIIDDSIKIKTNLLRGSYLILNFNFMHIVPIVLFDDFFRLTIFFFQIIR